MHGADPSVEGQTFVAREREGLPRRRGVEADVRGDHEDQDQDGECVDAARRHGLAEDPDEGVVGWVVDRGVDVREGKEVGYYYPEAEDAVEHV